MKRRLRPRRAGLAGLALATVALFAANAAHAEGPPPKTYDDLPLGAVPPRPAKMPRSLGGHERAAGIHVVRENNGKTVAVFGSAEDRRVVLAGTIADETACVVERPPEGFPDRLSLGDPQVVIWSDIEVSVSLRVLDAQRLVESSDRQTATLEIVQALVDSRTGGARLSGKASIPLVRVGGALDAIRVYAAREERAEQKLVHVVIKNQVTDFSHRTGWEVVRPSHTQRSSCSFAHVALRADGPNGDMVVARTPLVLPSVEPDAAAPTDAEHRPITLRHRDVEIQLGASQTKSDPRPLFTVGFAWASREQTSQVLRRPRIDPRL